MKIKLFLSRFSGPCSLAGVVAVVLVAHLAGGSVFAKRFVEIDSAGEALLNARFELDKKFYKSGYFSDAVKNGYNIFSDTPRYVPRFVGNDLSCIDCHSVEEIGYAFVVMDRYNEKHGRRMSFEEQVMRCYVERLDGYVPPFFDPALQDVKIFARFMSIGLALQEGRLISADK